MTVGDALMTLAAFAFTLWFWLFVVAGLAVATQLALGVVVGMICGVLRLLGFRL